MRYKIEKDPISEKILSCTLVRENTPIFSDDLLMDGKELPDIPDMAVMTLAEDGTFSYTEDTCMQKEDELREKLGLLRTECDRDYFLRLILEGTPLEEARQAIISRKGERKQLEEEIKRIEAEHRQHVQEYYMEQDREADAALSFLYYSAAILVIKDENRYLREWLDWHMALGFERIYIYDNGVKERVSEIVDACPEEMQKKIAVIDWTGHHEQIQQDAYNHFLRYYGKGVRWGMFLDSDEFVRFTGEETATVNEFLKQYENYTEVWGSSLEYNASGQETYIDAPVRERFTETTDVNEGKVYKHFIQVNRIDSFYRHFARYNEGKHFMFRNETDNRDLFVLDHYYTKSWEEWKVKILERGVCDPEYRKHLSEFFLYNPDMVYLDDGTDAVQAYEENANPGGEADGLSDYTGGTR